MKKYKNYLPFIALIAILALAAYFINFMVSSENTCDINNVQKENDRTRLNIILCSNNQDLNSLLKTEAENYRNELNISVKFIPSSSDMLVINGYCISDKKMLFINNTGIGRLYIQTFFEHCFPEKEGEKIVLFLNETKSGSKGGAK